MGSSNQNETRKEHRLRDMPPLGPMQKKPHVSEKNVGLGYFSTNLGFVLVGRKVGPPEVTREVWVSGSRNLGRSVGLENPCFMGLSQKTHVLGALSPSYKKTKNEVFKKKHGFKIFLTQNLDFSIGARLRYGQNLGRSETQTPFVTSGGLGTALPAVGSPCYCCLDPPPPH